MPVSPLAALLVLGPLVAGMWVWMAVDGLFGHPVANRCMKMAVVISTFTAIFVLHDWAIDTGLLVVDHNMMNVTSVEALT